MPSASSPIACPVLDVYKRQGLEHMEPQERALLEGKYILAQSDKELAADFKCKPDSIRMKLTRARRKLLDIMKRSEEDD